MGAPQESRSDVGNTNTLPAISEQEAEANGIQCMGQRPLSVRKTARDVRKTARDVQAQ